MKKKHICRRLTHNTFSFEGYVRLFVVSEILFAFLYAGHISTFSLYGNKIWLFVSIIIIVSGFSLSLSWKRERNLISLISGVVLPILMYETVVMCKYSLTMRVVSTASVISSIVLSGVWAAGSVRKIKNKSVKTEIFVIKASKISRIICCLLTIICCIYGKNLIASHYTVNYNEIDYIVSDDYSEISDYENSLTANIEMVSKIDTYGGWELLTIEEKAEVLETIIRVECRFLGMCDSAPSLEIAYLEEGLLGQYDPKRDVITLSYNYIVDSHSDGYYITKVLCHELYHRYQEYQVELLEVLKSDPANEKYADLFILDDAEIYKEEMDNYYSPADNSVTSYFLYSSQQLEQDAENYGTESMRAYYDRIHSYLNLN